MERFFFKECKLNDGLLFGTFKVYLSTHVLIFDCTFTNFIDHVLDTDMDSSLYDEY